MKCFKSLLTTLVFSMSFLGFNQAAAAPVWGSNMIANAGKMVGGLKNVVCGAAGATYDASYYMGKTLLKMGQELGTVRTLPVFLSIYAGAIFLGEQCLPSDVTDSRGKVVVDNSGKRLCGRVAYTLATLLATAIAAYNMGWLDAQELQTIKDIVVAQGGDVALSADMMCAA